MEEKKQGRGRNMEDEESRQICVSFIFVSENGITGTSQKGDTFYKDVSDHYSANLPPGRPSRTMRSLESKWRTIHHDVAKFEGAFVQIKDINASGITEEDVLYRAQKLYYENSHKEPSKRKPFAFLECWRYLVNKPK